jgi:hypothetical protein
MQQQRKTILLWVSGVAFLLQFWQLMCCRAELAERAATPGGLNEQVNA